MEQVTEYVHMQCRQGCMREEPTTEHSDGFVREVQQRHMLLDVRMQRGQGFMLEGLAGEHSVNLVPGDTWCLICSCTV